MIKYHPTKGINPNKKVEGSDAILQRVYIRLKTHTGEWLLNENAGLPWVEWFQEKPTPIDEIKSYLFIELNQTPGVERVDTVSLEKEQAEINATFILTLETEDTARFQIEFDEFSNFSFSYTINPR